MKTLVASALIILVASGCTATRSAKEMVAIQRNEGFYTQSLWYRGSTQKHHFFDQDCHSALGLFNAATTKLFRVPLKQLSIPKELTFPFYEDVPNKLHIKIQSDPPYAVKLHKAPLSEAKKKVEAFRAPRPSKK
jgi:hypothetical protein